MKMIDVSKVRVFRGSLFVLLMLFMRIGWASNDDSTYNIVDFGAKGDGITDNTQFINRTIEACSTSTIFTGSERSIWASICGAAGMCRAFSSVCLHPVVISKTDRIPMVKRCFFILNLYL